MAFSTWCCKLIPSSDGSMNPPPPPCHCSSTVSLKPSEQKGHMQSHNLFIHPIVIQFADQHVTELGSHGLTPRTLRNNTNTTLLCANDGFFISIAKNVVRDGIYSAVSRPL